MGYIENMNDVITIHEFQLGLNKVFSLNIQKAYLSKEIGEDQTYYAKEFKKKSEEYTILQLWTIFERHLFELTNQYVHKNNDKGTMRYVIVEKMIEKIERWPLGEILDLYKIIIDANTVGVIKQIKRYRDWLVHKNPKKGSPGKISYEDTYIYLSDFLNFITADLSRNSKDDKK